MLSSVERGVTVVGFTNRDKILVAATTNTAGGRAAFNLLEPVGSVGCHVYFGAQTSDVWFRLGDSVISLADGVSPTATDDSAALMHVPAGTFVMLWVDARNLWCRDISLDTDGVFRVVRAG